MKTLIAGLTAVAALAAAVPAAQAQLYGHGYGHDRGEWRHDNGRHEGWRRHDGWRGERRYYGPPRHYRHGYATRCFWRYGHRVCRSW